MTSPGILLPAVLAPRSPPAIPERDAAQRGLAGVAGRLMSGGAVLHVLALATFSSLRCAGLLDLDTMTLLPAAASAGAAAMSLGAALACLRALRSA